PIRGPTVVGQPEAVAATAPEAKRARLLLAEYAAGQLQVDDRRRRAPYPGLVNGRLAAWWRRWQDSTARDVVSALIVTAILLAGSYGEAHPNQPFDTQQHGHKVPYTPDVALLLVVAACLVLALKRRYPELVLGASTAAV